MIEIKNGFYLLKGNEKIKKLEKNKNFTFRLSPEQEKDKFFSTFVTTRQAISRKKIAERSSYSKHVAHDKSHR